MVGKCPNFGRRAGERWEGEPVRKLPGWVWFAVVPALVLMALAFTLERVLPDSRTIEKLGRDDIAAQTGHDVTSISCKKVLHIRKDMDLPCDVVLDDGTSYTSTARVDAHYRYANHYGFSAEFSLPPGMEPRRPIPPRVPPVAPAHPNGSATSTVDANDLAACVQAAGQDIAKLQACTQK
jgi:hypothetical protein